MPSLHQPPAGRFLEGHKEPSQKRGRATTQSRELIPTEFAYAFSLYRDVLCSHYPGHCQEMDDYLAIILNLALRFGSNGFYQYHIHFASEAAARLQQVNEDTYWGSLDNEIYCRIFAAHATLPCSLCGAPFAELPHIQPLLAPFPPMPSLAHPQQELHPSLTCQQQPLQLLYLLSQYQPIPPSNLQPVA